MRAIACAPPPSLSAPEDRRDGCERAQRRVGAPRRLRRGGDARGRPAALTFWDALRETRILCLTADSIQLEDAWSIDQAYSDQSFSLVDCVTFDMMERQGIHEAFAFDAHFLVYRFGPARQRDFRRLPRGPAAMHAAPSDHD